MEPKKIEELVVKGESYRIEFKSSDAWKEKINRAICAFANDIANYGLPGYVIIGIDDTGKPTGEPVTDNLLRDLASMRSDGNILPYPMINVEKLTLLEQEAAVVEVFPSNSPPVRYKGVVWISVGPTRRIATPEEEKRLIERRRAGILSFDQQPITGTTVADLDIDLFKSAYLPFAVAPEVLDQNSRDIAQQLVSLRFLSFDYVTPTVAGMLAIGKEPGTWLPGAYLQFVRYAGRDSTFPIINNIEISGNLISQLRRIKDMIPSQIQVAQSNPDGITNVNQPDYPVRAISELIFNAFLHRAYEGTNSPIRYTQYDDRIEILSPGGLFGQVTPDNIEKGVTDYRNPVIAEIMKALGYVQRFGVGIQTARRELANNGNPPLEFIFEPTFFFVKIWRLV